MSFGICMRKLPVSMILQVIKILESEARVPKIDLVKQMSQIFDVNTHALTVPDIDTHIGLMHTLFALEDIYGLKVKNIDGQPHLCRCV